MIDLWIELICVIVMVVIGLFCQALTRPSAPSERGARAACDGASECTDDKAVSLLPEQLAAMVGGSQLQDKVAARYKKFKPKGKKLSFREYCLPKGYSIQPQQLFMGEYMSRRDCPQEMLIFHEIGSGKTCLSIQIGKHYIGRSNRPLFVMPASLIPGFRNELRGGCGEGKFMDAKEAAVLAEQSPGSGEYRAILEAANAKIDATYNIMSYNKFATSSASGTDDVRAPLLVVDEVQNVSNQGGAFHKRIMKWIMDNPRAVVVLMSATPIFDSPGELTNIARMMRADIPIGQMVTPADVPKYFAGKVSFFAGAPAYTFPKVNIKIKHCPMSVLQSRWYQSQVESEMKGSKLITHPVDDSFYIKSRQRSNVVFPNGVTGLPGLALLTPALIRSALDTYSVKFAKLIRKLDRGHLAFVFTRFTQAGGIRTLMKCLEVHGWHDFAVAGPGVRRFAVWSGDQTAAEKDIIRATFNSPENDDATKLRVIIGSPAIKEGVSLLRVRQVHLLEAHWNHSSLAQIYGRAVRYCSHLRLPAEERSVDIYIYCAQSTYEGWDKNRFGDGALTNPLYSIDQYMLDIADSKKEASAPLVKALVDVAVDKKLWPNS